MKLFELYEKQPLREAKMLNESIRLCKAVLALLEANDFEWEPQPEFKGVKGVSTDVGPGVRDAAAAKKKQAEAKLNATWQKLLRQAKGMDREGAAKLKGYLQQIAAAAKQRGFKLSPSPEDTLGLGIGTGI